MKRLLIFSVINILMSATQNRPDTKVVSEGNREIVAESIYRFSVSRYQPPILVTPSTELRRCTHQDPEEEIHSMISAMSHLDFESWIECWSTASRPKSDQTAREQLVEAWKRVVRGNVAVLQYRIATGDYVLIEYLIIPPNSSVEHIPPDAITSTITFEKTQTGWFATNDLAADPVRLFWKTPNYRPRSIAR